MSTEDFQFFPRGENGVGHLRQFIRQILGRANGAHGNPKVVLVLSIFKTSKWDTKDVERARAGSFPFN